VLAKQLCHVQPIILYENIDQILRNKLHEPMHYIIDVTYVYNRHKMYTLL